MSRVCVWGEIERTVRAGNIPGRDAVVGLMVVDRVSAWSHEVLLDAAGKAGIHGIEAQEWVAQQVRNASARAGRKLLSAFQRERQKCRDVPHSCPATQSWDLQYIKTNRWGQRQAAQVLARRRSTQVNNANQQKRASGGHQATSLSVRVTRKNRPTINLDAVEVSCLLSPLSSL